MMQVLFARLRHIAQVHGGGRGSVGGGRGGALDELPAI